MKGRRRARQFALQALYELDQSDHELERVLYYRLQAYYRAVSRAALEEGQKDLGVALTERLRLLPITEPWSDAEVDEAAAGLGRSREELVPILEAFAGHRKQVVYGVSIVRGVVHNREAIDGVIARIAPEWPVHQMAPIDRNTLRVALWEIGGESVPLRVVINEAVELARRFSGEGSRRMVNGALGAYTSNKMKIEIEDIGA